MRIHVIANSWAPPEAIEQINTDMNPLNFMTILICLTKQSNFTEKITIDF